MVKGAGETFAKAVGFGPAWAWAVFWVCFGALLSFKGVFRRVETVLFLFPGLLSISLIGVALWSGPNPVEAAKGVFLFELPADKGAFGVVLVVTSLIEAVGGTITNLFYPYFIAKKKQSHSGQNRLLVGALDNCTGRPNLLQSQSSTLPHP